MFYSLLEQGLTKKFLEQILHLALFSSHLHSKCDVCTKKSSLQTVEDDPYCFIGEQPEEAQKTQQFMLKRHIAHPKNDNIMSPKFRKKWR